MSARHRVRYPCIQIIKTATVAPKDCKRANTQQVGVCSPLVGNSCAGLLCWMSAAACADALANAMGLPCSHGYEASYVPIMTFLDILAPELFVSLMLPCMPMWHATVLLTSTKKLTLEAWEWP
eukprot:1137409-Pelagomonas_calceolata.AAC.3